MKFPTGDALPLQFSVMAFRAALVTTDALFYLTEGGLSTNGIFKFLDGILEFFNRIFDISINFRGTVAARVHYYRSISSRQRAKGRGVIAWNTRLSFRIRPVEECISAGTWKGYTFWTQGQEFEA